jgi:hypothetical protein
MARAASLAMRTAALILIALAACSCAEPPADDTAQRFTAFLNRQIGKSEPDLVRAFRRIPDANYQQDATTRMLMWKMAATFTTPGRSPDYAYIGGSIVPVGGRAPVSTTEYCHVEWIVTDGVAKAYNLHGKGCP